MKQYPGRKRTSPSGELVFNLIWLLHLTCTTLGPPHCVQWMGSSAHTHTLPLIIWVVTSLMGSNAGLHKPITIHNWKDHFYSLCASQLSCSLRHIFSSLMFCRLGKIGHKNIKELFLNLGLDTWPWVITVWENGRFPECSIKSMKNGCQNDILQESPPDLHSFISPSNLSVLSLQHTYKDRIRIPLLSMSAPTSLLKFLSAPS